MHPALPMLWIAGSCTLFAFGDAAVSSVPVLNASRAAWALVLAALLAGAATRRGALRRPGPVELAGGAYLTVVIASWATTHVSADAAAWRRDGALVLEGVAMPLSAFVFGRNAAWTRRRRIACLWVLVAGAGVYLAAVGALQYAFGWTCFGPQDPMPIHAGRAKGPFTNALGYGMVVSILLFLGVFLYLHSATRRARVALGAIGAALVLAIVFAQGRAVWLAVPLAALYAWRRCPRVRPLARRAALPGALAAAVLLGGGLDRERLAARLTEREPIESRLVLWTTTLRMIADSPWVGFGFAADTYPREKDPYVRAWRGLDVRLQWGVSSPHQELLFVAMTTGLVGLVAYLSWLLAAWRAVTRERGGADPFRAELGVFVGCGFLVVLVNGLFIDLVYLGSVSSLLFFLIGGVSADEPGGLDAAV